MSEDLSSAIRAFTDKTMTITAEQNKEIYFDYMPDIVDTLILTNVILHPRSIVALRSSKVANYHYTGNIHEIMLPSTSVDIDTIKIRSKSNIIKLDIPICEYLNVQCNSLKLVGSNLGKRTKLKYIPRILLTKCNNVETLSMDDDDEMSSATIIGMPTLSKVNSDIELNIADCPNITDLFLRYNDLTLDTILELEDMYLEGPGEYNEYAKLTILRAKNLIISHSTIDSLDLAADTVRSIRTFDLKNASINSLIQKSKVLTKICTYEELDMNIVKGWLDQGNKVRISSNNDYNELWKSYPSVEFDGILDNADLLANNYRIERKNKTLEELAEY